MATFSVMRHVVDFVFRVLYIKLEAGKCHHVDITIMPYYTGGSGAQQLI